MPNLGLGPEPQTPGPDPLTCPDAYHMIGVKRSVAFVIDMIIMNIVLCVLYLALLIAGFMSFGLFWLFFPIAGTVVLIGYPTWYLAKPSGTTPGMSLMGIEMRRTVDNDAPRWLAPFIRTLLFYVIGSVTAWLALLYSYFDPNRRCLHDILSSTLVVNKDVESQTDSTHIRET